MLRTRCVQPKSVPCAAPALVGFVQGSVSSAIYAATEKIAYGRNPSFKETLKVGITSGIVTHICSIINLASVRLREVGSKLCL